VLRGHRSGISALAFSPTGSNILASGSSVGVRSLVGEIKLWDVVNQVRIHAFQLSLLLIRDIFFSPGDNIQCYVLVTMAGTWGGTMIRIVRNERMEFASTILEEPSLGKLPLFLQSSRTRAEASGN
jgi:WD40 repeat protein